MLNRLKFESVPVFQLPKLFDYFVRYKKICNNQREIKEMN